MEMMDLRLVLMQKIEKVSYREEIIFWYPFL